MNAEKTYICSRCGREHRYEPGWDVDTVGDLKRLEVNDGRITALYLCDRCGWPIAALVNERPAAVAFT